MRRRALVAGILGVALVLAIPGAAHAEVPVSQVGWWTRSPTPPAVPDGGISVGAAPDGALTVGAVVVDAGGGASGASLRLVESSGGTGAQVAGIRVCPTSTSWSAADGGPMTDAPKDECKAASVPMKRGADGTWTAKVQELLAGKTGAVGLIVVPAANAVAFQLSFAPPTVDGSVSEGAAPETQTTTATTFAPSGSSSGSPSFAAPAPPSTPSFVAPVTPAPQVAAPVSDGSSATAADVAFVPEIGAGVPAGGGGGSHVTKATMLLWYMLAMVVGLAVTGVVRLKNEGRLSPAAFLARARR